MLCCDLKELIHKNIDCGNIGYNCSIILPPETYAIAKYTLSQSYFADKPVPNSVRVMQ